MDPKKSIKIESHQKVREKWINFMDPKKSIKIESHQNVRKKWIQI